MCLKLKDTIDIDISTENNDYNIIVFYELNENLYIVSFDLLKVYKYVDSEKGSIEINKQKFLEKYKSDIILGIEFYISDELEKEGRDIRNEKKTD